MEAVALNPSVDKTITVDRFTPFGLNRVQSVRLDPGGKGVNVARVLSSFGAGAVMSGFAAGEQGRLLEQQLRQLGIHSLLQPIDGQTRTNLKIIEACSGRLTEINEPGPTPSEAALDDFQRGFEARLDQTGVVVLSGSLPPNVPPDFYARCVRLAKARGVVTLLDADGAALAAGAVAAPFAIKPNLHELEQLCGRTLKGIDEILRAARSLIGQGVRIVIVSFGAEGALVAGQNEAYKTTPWSIRAQSPTGAGDSMVAALAWGLLGSLPLVEIARLVTAAGTVTAAKPGTALCTRAEVTDRLKDVGIEKIEDPATAGP